MTSQLAGREVYIVDGSRTPYLKAKGKPGAFSASDLAVYAGRELLARQPFTPDQLDEVVLGCIMPGPDEANIGRVVSLRLGCGKSVPAWTVQRNCASGMQALDSAAMNISHGRADLVLAGGTEAMSHAPVLLNEAMVGWLAAWAGARSFGKKIRTLAQLRPGHLKPIIALLRGLTDPVVGLSMGQTAEIIAHRFGISRSEMDQFAEQSHHRLAAAQEAGHLDEIVPIFDSRGNHFDRDNGLRADTSAEQLSKLRPVFDRHYGKVTAGNSAQITDGAAWLLLASADAVKKYNLPVLGRIADVQWAGLDPAQMGLGPVHSSAPILNRNGFGLDDIDYWEINEAFAAQVLGCQAAFKDPDYCREELGLDDALGALDSSRINVDGGAISIGHPVGSSGARITLHLLHVLRQNNAKRGIATLCIGGGQGGALLVENTAEVSA